MHEACWARRNVYSAPPRYYKCIATHGTPRGTHGGPWGVVQQTHGQYVTMCTGAHSKLHSGILPGSKPQHEIQKNWFGPGNRLSADPEWQGHLKLWIFYTDKWRHAVVAVIVTSCATWPTCCCFVRGSDGTTTHKARKKRQHSSQPILTTLARFWSSTTSQCRSCGWGVRHNSTMGGCSTGPFLHGWRPSSMRVRSFALEELQSKQEHGFP